MTAEELKQYSGLCKSADAISAYISVLSKSDTGCAGLLIEILTKRMKDQIDQIQQIEDWIQSIPEEEIRNIAEYRILKGMSWSDICMQLYGYPDSYYCRNVFIRYVQKNESSTGH